MTKAERLRRAAILIAPLPTPGPLAVKATRTSFPTTGKHLQDPALTASLRAGCMTAAGQARLPRQTRRDHNPKNDPHSCRETQKFAGGDAAWGNKPLALFQTSDSRDESFETLAQHSTWVKWAEPTAEALRQACLGRQSRISQGPPQLPSIVISRLQVSNSKFLGPVDISFNPQFNALIGGRGTGKSTVLDYLRWGLCDEAATAVEDEEVANPRLRRRRLIADTFVPHDGQVEVHFVINEIPHVVRRSSATGEVLLKVGSEQFVKTRDSDVRALLPIHAYCQKQLSSVSVRMDELTRFVTAPIKPALARGC